MTNKILIQNRHKMVLVELCDIFYIANEKRKVFVHVADESYWAYCSMSSILQHGDERLHRCHHSLAVNFEKLVAIDDDGLHLSNDICLPMCRASVQRAKKAWLAYLGGRD
jgi:DNA-binding LytR/AlgR family response regulator